MAVDLSSRPAAQIEDSGPRLRFRGLESLDVMIPAGALCLVAFACFVWPEIYALSEPTGGSVAEAGRPLFSRGHLLGTDLNGNDVLARLLHGGRVSLLIATAVNLLGLSVGGMLGAFSAYVGGFADSVTMRIIDVLIAFPSLVLVLAISYGLGPSIVNTIWALSFVSIPVFARIARASTLRLREEPFMIAAVLSGTCTRRILLRHIVPCVLPQLGTFALLGMGIAIIVEGALSFLGLGVPEPAPSWGNMIAHGEHALLTKPSLVLLPSAFLFATVASLNLLGEALRSRWNAP